MGYLSKSTGLYYEGDQQWGDIPYPAPPGPTYIPDGVGDWTKTPDVAKVDQLVLINTTCADLLAQVKTGYPDDEVQSWSKQEDEARSYVADNTSATPLLTAMSTAREITLADLAARVIEKADLFAVASGQIIGRRQLREDQINAATTAAEVLAIVW